jgi:hypothetical protein
MDSATIEQCVRELLFETDCDKEAERVYSEFQFNGTLNSELTGKLIDINRVPNGRLNNNKFASLFMSYENSNLITCIDKECSMNPFTNIKLMCTEQDVAHFKTLMTAGHSIQGIYCTYYKITTKDNGSNRCIYLRNIYNEHTIIPSGNTSCNIIKWDAVSIQTPELLLVNVLITDSKNFPNGDTIMINSEYYNELLNTLLDTNDLTVEQYNTLYNSLIKNCLGITMENSKQLITRLIKEFSVSLDTKAKISDYNAELYQYANTEVCANANTNTVTPSSTQLTCSICNNVMESNDRVLSCGHYVCINCSNSVNRHCDIQVSVIQIKSNTIKEQPKKAKTKRICKQIC